MKSSISKNTLSIQKIPKYTIGIAIIAITFLSLSVHVVMMTGLHIPYPNHYPKIGFPVYLKDLGMISATLFMYQLYYHQHQHRHRSMMYQIGIVTLLLLTLNESLIRAPLMDAIATSAWLYSFIGNLPKVFYYFAISLFTVIFSYRLNSLWGKTVAIVLMAIFIEQIFSPLSQKLTASLLTFAPTPRLEDIIQPPYGLNILLPAYLTYIEASISCFVIAWLGWPNLNQYFKRPIIVFTLLIVLLTGKFFAPFLYPFYTDLPPFMAMLSVGQFSLASMLLGLLTVILVKYLYIFDPHTDH